MLSHDRLVVKLPDGRVAGLIGAGIGEPFDGGKARRWRNVPWWSPRWSPRRVNVKVCRSEPEEFERSVDVPTNRSDAGSDVGVAGDPECTDRQIA